jgi:hypothetical protein
MPSAALAQAGSMPKPHTPQRTVPDSIPAPPPEYGLGIYDVPVSSLRVPRNSDSIPNGVQVGQVFVTPLAVGTVSTSPLWGLSKPPKAGYHFVVVSLRIQNTTLYPNCTDWNSKLMTDGGHKYGNQIFRAPDPPKVNRLPFRAQSQGGYAFQVRDGETPVGLSLERLYEIERICWNSTGFSPVEPFVATVNISLERLPEPTSPLQPIEPYPAR